MTNLELATLFRKAADHLAGSPLRELPIDNVKLFLLSALNDLDRAADYGKPGAGIDELLGKGEK